MMEPLDQISGSWPAIIGGFFGGFSVVGGFVVKHFMKKERNSASDSAAIANDEVSENAVVMADKAMKILWELLNDTRDKQKGLSDRLDVAFVDILRLQSELRASKSSEARLTERVQVLEYQLREAGLPIPPERQ